MDCTQLHVQVGVSGWRLRRDLLARGQKPRRGMEANEQGGPPLRQGDQRVSDNYTTRLRTNVRSAVLLGNPSAALVSSLHIGAGKSCAKRY